MKLHVLLSFLLLTASLNGCYEGEKYTVVYECKTTVSQILLEQYVITCANKAPPHSDAEVDGVVSKCAAEGRRAVCSTRIIVPD